MSTEIRNKLIFVSDDKDNVSSQTVFKALLSQVGGIAMILGERAFCETLNVRNVGLSHTFAIVTEGCDADQFGSKLIGSSLYSPEHIVIQEPARDKAIYDALTFCRENFARVNLIVAIPSVTSTSSFFAAAKELVNGIKAPQESVILFHDVLSHNGNLQSANVTLAFKEFCGVA